MLSQKTKDGFTKRRNYVEPGPARRHETIYSSAFKKFLIMPPMNE